MRLLQEFLSGLLREHPPGFFLDLLPGFYLIHKLFPGFLWELLPEIIREPLTFRDSSMNSFLKASRSFFLNSCRSFWNSFGRSLWNSPTSSCDGKPPGVYHVTPQEICWYSFRNYSRIALCSSLSNSCNDFLKYSSTSFVKNSS